MMGEMGRDWAAATEFFRRQGVRFLENTDTASALTLGIGGRARLLAYFQSEGEIGECRRVCGRSGIPLVILGGGSNVAFADGQLEMVVGINQVGGISEYQGTCLQVGSGVKNGALLSWCQSCGIGGLEFLAGIPGTIGGAAAVNAGAFGISMADVLVSARIITAEVEVLEKDKDYFCFSYRHSKLKLSTEIILSVLLQCRTERGKDLARRIDENQRYRLNNHPPYHLRTAGCFFRNPEVKGVKISAGRILEECGLSGKSFGPLRLSERHANFLINEGGASFSDLAAAEESIVLEVKKRKGITLEREVVYIDSVGSKW